MSVDLAKPASRVDFTGAAYQPLLERLQANIVKSHGRDGSGHVFPTLRGGEYFFAPSRPFLAAL
ncbi:MAG TPA: hypothetical protein VF535_02205 [Allosphingosinicella sp.]|jgi:hypothetical protein